VVLLAIISGLQRVRHQHGTHPGTRLCSVAKMLLTTTGFILKQCLHFGWEKINVRFTQLVTHDEAKSAVRKASSKKQEAREQAFTICIGRYKHTFYCIFL
jgi:hypothetical protein